jgi:hypothetical protein
VAQKKRISEKILKKTEKNSEKKLLFAPPHWQWLDSPTASKSLTQNVETPHQQTVSVNFYFSLLFVYK